MEFKNVKSVQSSINLAKLITKLVFTTICLVRLTLTALGAQKTVNNIFMSDYVS